VFPVVLSTFLFFCSFIKHSSLFSSFMMTPVCSALMLLSFFAILNPLCSVLPSFVQSFLLEVLFVHVSRISFLYIKSIIAAWTFLHTFFPTPFSSVYFLKIKKNSVLSSCLFFFILILYLSCSVFFHKISIFSQFFRLTGFILYLDVHFSSCDLPFKFKDWWMNALFLFFLTRSFFY
jgi:hypothetical protein